MLSRVSRFVNASSLVCNTPIFEREPLPSLTDGVTHLSRRLHHVLQCRPDLFRLAGFQPTVGVHPDAVGLQHGEDGLKLANQLRRVGDTRAMDVVDAGADPLVVALSAEDL